MALFLTFSPLNFCKALYLDILLKSVKEKVDCALQIKWNNLSCISSFVKDSKGRDTDTILLFKGRDIFLPCVCLHSSYHPLPY